MIEATKLIEIYNNIIDDGSEKSWVIYKNGTVVIFMEPVEDLKKAANDIMIEYGPVHPGTPSGDFTTIDLVKDPGYIVACHHPDVLSYVGPDEFEGEFDEVTVGIQGRIKRAQDAADLEVIHVQNNRK